LNIMLRCQMRGDNSNTPQEAISALRRIVCEKSEDAGYDERDCKSGSSA
jgi:hypothetical protein